MSNREFTATRTMLANAFATAGAELLEYMGTAAALAAIPNTDPPRYVVAGTLAMIAKVLPSADAPAAATVLTDERIEEITRSLFADGTFTNDDLMLARSIEAELLAHAGKVVAALEEAAKLCDEKSKLWGAKGCGHDGAYMSQAADELSVAIRSLAKQSTAAPASAQPADELDHGETVLLVQEALGITRTGWVSPDVIMLRIEQLQKASAHPDRGAVRGDLRIEPMGNTHQSPYVDASPRPSNLPDLLAAAPSPASQPVAPALTDERIKELAQGLYHMDYQDDPHGYDIELARRVEAAVAPSDAKGKADAANAGDLTAESLAQLLAGKYVNDYGYRMLLNGEEIGFNLQDLLDIVKTASRTQSPATSAADAKDAARSLKDVSSDEMRLELHLRQGPRYKCMSPDCHAFHDSPGKWDACPSCGRKGYLCGAFEISRESAEWKAWEQRVVNRHRAAMAAAPSGEKGGA